ncbi:MAG TPA: hypothetical protein VMT16_12195 [Thermoanaerobaculia bacterium]|nr:hypothetical protein [Thermoanaerobaculia bacterium]
MKRLTTALATTLAMTMATPGWAGSAATAETPLVRQYLAIHARLAADSAAGVEESAKAVAAAARKAAPAAADRSRMERIAAAAEGLHGRDLTKLRAGFEELSREMAAWAEVVGVAGVGLYYCPMAKAHWLQAAGPVKNPYYGSSMLACGARAEAVR